VEGTEACVQHWGDWVQHCQAQSKATLAGVHRILNHQGENLAWNKYVEWEV
jgi:hypothetical protein